MAESTTMPKNQVPELPNHGACGQMVALTLQHLPRDRELGTTRRYEGGEEIWAPADRADRVYFLKTGQVVIRTGKIHGRDFVLQLVDAEHPFGELCFCSGVGGLRHSAAYAVTESAALEIALNEFLQYLQEHQGALLAFMFGMCVRLTEAQRSTEMLTHRGAEARLGRLLLQLTAGRGRVEAKDAGEVALQVSHKELAEMAAMSRAHVTVTLGKLRQRSLIRYGRNRSLVVNPSSLERYLARGPRARKPVSGV
jgi:CRP/FNR family transcriptional regulator, cyclic AMP receptor protein